MVNITNKEESISRVLRSHKEAKDSYDRMSRWYDWVSGRSENKFITLGLEKFKCRTGDQVLEIGFGTGFGLMALARSVGLSGRVLGIDISEGMGRMARERLIRSGLEDQVQMICADGLELPFQEQVFDAIFMSFTLELFDTPEIPQVLKECRRVLHRRGRLGVVSLSRTGKTGWGLKIYEWIHRKLPRYVDCRPIYVREALAHADFSIVSREVRAMWGLPVEIILAAKTESNTSE